MDCEHGDETNGSVYGSGGYYHCNSGDHPGPIRDVYSNFELGT